ncbi:hypothetical protein JCM3775_001143 [Rhodotorula graminis]
MQRKHVCILPTDIPLEEAASDPSSSSSARFLRLPHPRTNQPALFLPYSPSGSSSPADGLLEVQKISLDADKSRCWFLPDEVASDGSLAIFSPFDPVFLVLAYLSLLAPHFQSYADLWDSVAQLHFKVDGGGDAAKTGDDESDEQGGDFADDLGRLAQLDCVRERLLKVCETQEHESTTLYRLSPSLALDLLRAKVDALARVDGGIFGPLESTQLGEEAKPAPAAEPVGEGEQRESGPQAGSRRFSTVSRGLAKEGAGSGHGLSEQLQIESRQKYAVGVVANYLPAKLVQDLLASYSFPALTAYLSSSATSSVLGSTYLPGRAAAKLEAALAGGDSGFGAAAKKRKAAESKGSRGVEALKKVNTKGMASLKDMFGRQAAGKKPEAAKKEAADESGPAKKKRKA